MKLCNELSLFILIVLVLYYTNMVNSPGKLSKSVFWALLVWVFYTNFMGNSVELFHFEVTPWKKTCGNKHPNRCPGCCLPGFNGQPIHFEYTGDEERMNAVAAGCTQRDPNTMLKNHVYDYSDLENTYASLENYCGKNDHRSVSAYGPGITPGEPQGLKQYATGTQPTIELYGCNQTVEGYGCSGAQQDVVEPYEDCGCSK